MTKRSDPEMAIPIRFASPETSEAFTVAPEVVYSPILPLIPSATKRSDPETTMPVG